MIGFFKNKYGVMTPQAVIMILATLIVLSVAIFAFYTTTNTLNNTGIGPSDTTCQAVADPSAQQSVTIGTGATVITVTETLSDSSTQTIDSGNYSYDPNTGVVTVNVTG